MRGNLNTRISPPSGWKLVRRDVIGNTLTKAIFVRTARKDEPSRYRFSFSREQTVNVTILTFSGVDRASPIASSAMRETSRSKAVTAPGLIAPVDGGYIVGLYATGCRTKASPPLGMTERADFSQTFITRYYLTSAVATQLIGSGKSGKRTATMGCSADNIGQLLLLRPGN
jgi:hypothetical protein